MPGFFVDRQDYGGFLPTRYWDNLNTRDMETGIPPVVADTQVGIGGSYDFWHTNTINDGIKRRNIYTYADDPCCCPELSCCFPNTVTATIAGFNEATRVPSRSISKWVECGGALDTYIPPKSAGSLSWYINTSWCSAFIEEGLPSRGVSSCSDCNLVPGASWDSSTGECVIVEDDYRCCPEGAQYWATLSDPRAGSCLSACGPGTPENNYNIVEGDPPTVPETWNEICCKNWSLENSVDYCDINADLGFDACTAYQTGDPSFYKNTGLSYEHQDVQWPIGMFPPKSCTCIACCGYATYNLGSYQVVCNNTAYSVGEYYYIPESHIPRQFPNSQVVRPESTNYLWSEICNDTQYGLGVLCDKPTSSNIIYGPSSYRYTQPDAGKGPQIYDGDHNGTYVCHKTVNSFRPELQPYIQRQISLNRPEAEEDRARLLFEVECRRKMFYTSCGCALGENMDQLIQGFDCDYKYPEPTDTDINNLEVPTSKIYCVDYPCDKQGRSLPTYINQSFYREVTGGCTDPDADDGFCGKFECQASAGSAYPDLMLYQYISESGDGGYIDFETVPEVYENGYPTAWGVNNFTITGKGSGYMIGDTFLVDFDGRYIRRLLLPDGTYIWRGGQTYPKSPVHISLDQIEFFCEGSSSNISPIEEKYNSIEPSNLIGFPFEEDPAFLFSFSWPHPVQTIRVTEVGVSGQIEAVERVPWYKETEYDALCNIVTGNDRTPIYPLYARQLCHPQTVQHKGKGYSVGDTIVWMPVDGGQDVRVWKDQYAIAYVVDVDDEGGVLDWFISGGIYNLNESIFQRFYGSYEDGAPLLGYLYNRGDLFYPSPCYGSSTPTFDTGLYGPNYDKRGYYYYNGTNLCSLEWTGVGLPVRARSARNTDLNSEVSVGFLADPNVNWNCPTAIIDYNSGYLTSLRLSISRVVAETTAGVSVNKYRYIPEVYAKILIFYLFDPEADGDIFRAIVDFSPFPECVGGGAEIIPVVYDCSDPTNSSCGNESIFGGSLSGAIVASSGAYYSFINLKHTTPILPTEINIPNGSGQGATISEFSFDAVDNFPNPVVYSNRFYLNHWGDISYSGLTSDRYSYFPLTGITIDNPGSGYEIDQEFELYPQEGKEFVRGWEKNTGDDPNSCPNGGWYGENTGPGGNPWNYVNSSGHWDWIRERNIEPLKSKAKIKITGIDENGGITELTIIDKGMMFRSVETTGVLHPDVFPYLDSTLGYGAIQNVTIGTDKNAETFGKVINFYFTNPVFFAEYDEFGQLTSYGGHDPLHSNFGVNPPVLVGWTGNATKGYGRDYANPENGYFWILDNVDIDTGVKLLAYYPFGDAFNGPTSTQYYTHQSGAVSYDYIHPEYSTHRIVEGAMPNYVPKSTICSFNDCYHELLNKQYPLYRTWQGNDDVGGPAMAAQNLDVTDPTYPFCIPPCEFNAYPYGTNDTYEVDGRPFSNFCVLLKKGKSINSDCTPEGYVDTEGENSNNYALGINYTVVEYGFTMTLSTNMTPNECPDHHDGRTFDATNTVGYITDV